jgi:dual oxidase
MLFPDYSVETEHSGLRRIAGYGVTVTRGAASAIMFTYSSLMVTMCRNTITFLRDTLANFYFPFDSFVFIHKYIAYWALFFTGKNFNEFKYRTLVLIDVYY